MTATESIAIGVASGVLTTALIYLAVTVFRLIVVPWYRALRYRGLNISGQWKETVRYGDVTDLVTFDLTQHEQDVSGLMHVVKLYPRMEGDESKVFEISGSFVDGYLLLHARSQDRTKQSFATFLLKVVGDGQRLSGQTSWLDANADRLISRESTLSRG